MVETTKKLVNGDSNSRAMYRWPLESIRNDLIVQGGLEESLLTLPFVDHEKEKRNTSDVYTLFDNPFTCSFSYLTLTHETSEIADNYFTDHGTYLAVYDGKYNGTRFRMRWRKRENDCFLVVRMEQPCVELVQAFSKIIGHELLTNYPSSTDNGGEKFSFVAKWSKEEKR
ncbi:MAG: hypothetical protein RL557_110 [archaeon]|jgi:hypothetical protein